jgi:drug/metabolite transporter (DMT)-like permease
MQVQIDESWPQDLVGERCVDHMPMCVELRLDRLSGADFDDHGVGEDHGDGVGHRLVHGVNALGNVNGQIHRCKTRSLAISPLAPPGTPPQVRSSKSGSALAFVILVWGLGPPISKLITAPAVISVLYRFWLSVPILFIFAAMRGVRPTWDSVRHAVLAGAAFGINLVFVFLTINEGAVAVLSVFAAMQPGIILLIAGPFLGERPGVWHVAWTFVGIGGTAIVVTTGGEGFEVSAAALIYGAVAQFFFTAYFLLTKRERSRHDIDSVQWMSGVVIWAAIAVTPWALLTSSAEDYRAINGWDWLWLALIIVFTGGLGHIVMAWVHRYVEASRSSLFLLSMNIVAIIAAWVIHDEPLTVVQILGGAVVFTAVAAVISRPPDRSERS